MKVDPQRLVFGLFLLVLIVIGVIIFGALKVPAWPAFMIMIFFFVEHMDVKKALPMLVGGLFGIICLILIQLFGKALAPALGAELANIIFICIFVYAIVAFGEAVPVVLNNYAFMFFTVAIGVAVAGKASPNDIYIWMAVELIGGGLFIAGIIGILKLLMALAKKKATKAG